MTFFISCGVIDPQEVPGIVATFPFRVNEISNVKVDVINSYDTNIKTLIDSELQPGLYQVTWNSTDMKNRNVVEGIYFFELFINGQFSKRQTIVMEVP
jgi:flagellar hook assembly protein FlgD